MWYGECVKKETKLERIVGLYKQNILFKLQSTYIYVLI